MPTTTVSRENQYWINQALLVRDESVDQMHVGTPYFDMLKAKFGEGKPEEEGGDLLPLYPWTVGEHSSPTVLTTGWEPINLASTSVEVYSQFSWFEVVMPVVTSGKQNRYNSGKGQKAKILDKNMKAVINAFKRKFLQQTLSGNVTGWSGLLTWNGVDNTTNGFLEQDAIGSQTNSIGGLAKSTYATYRGVQNQRYDCAGSFNTNGVASLISVNTQIRVSHPENKGPDGWLCEPTFLDFLKRTLLPQEQYVNGANGQDPGKMYMVWDGAKMYAQADYMPKTGTNTTADPISAYASSLDYMHTVWMKDRFFSVTDFYSLLPSQDAEAALVCVSCQNICNHCGSQGIVFDGNTW